MSRLWSRPFVMVLVASTLAGLVHTALMAALPGYAISIGGGQQSAGMIMGIYSIAALLFRPVFGYLLDTTGRKAVLLIGCLLLLVGTVSLLWASTVWLLLAIRVVQGIGFSAITTSTGVIITDLTPKQRLSDGMGWIQNSNSFNLAVGPFTALAVLAAVGPSVLFPILAVLMALALAFVLPMVNPGDKPVPKPVHRWTEVPGEFAEDALVGAVNLEKADTPNLAGRLGNGTIPIALTSLFITLGMGTIFSFAPLYGKQMGLPLTQWFFPVYALASIMAVRLMSGRVTRRFGPVALALVSLVAVGCAYLLLGFSRHALPFLVAGFVLGAGAGMTLSMLNTLLMSNVPPEKRGTANAINFSAMDMGFGCGSIGGGLLAAALDYHYMYWFASLTAPTAIAILILTKRRKQA